MGQSGNGEGTDSHSGPRRGQLACSHQPKGQWNPTQTTVNATTQMTCCEVDFNGH